MDGYELLVASESWTALKLAESALFDAQKTLEKEGFGDASETLYQARFRVAAVENELRRHFKRLNERSSEEES